MTFDICTLDDLGAWDAMSSIRRSFLQQSTPDGRIKWQELLHNLQPCVDEAGDFIRTLDSGCGRRGSFERSLDSIWTYIQQRHSKTSYALHTPIY